MTCATSSGEANSNRRPSNSTSIRAHPFPGTGFGNGGSYVVASDQDPPSICRCTQKETGLGKNSGVKVT